MLRQRRNDMIKDPQIQSGAWVAPQAVVLGDVRIGDRSSVWYHATVRADREHIEIGKGSNIQDNAVVHVDKGYPVRIGDYVTIGHGAIIHGCSIGDNSLIGMGAILLNGVQIGQNCVIGAGALVTQHMIIPDNSLVIGSPAKVLRQVTPEELAANRRNANAYIEECKAQINS